jgi:hypothetical protein
MGGVQQFAARRQRREPVALADVLGLAVEEAAAVPLLLVVDAALAVLLARPMDQAAGVLRLVVTSVKRSKMICAKVSVSTAF